MKSKPKQRKSNFLRNTIVLAVLTGLGYLGYTYYQEYTAVEVETTPQENVQSEIKMIPVITEEQKEIEAIKKRQDFQQKQEEIENLRAETILLDERKAKREAEAAADELRREELRAKELELGF